MTCCIRMFQNILVAWKSDQILTYTYHTKTQHFNDKNYEWELIKSWHKTVFFITIDPILYKCRRDCTALYHEYTESLFKFHADAELYFSSLNHRNLFSDFKTCKNTNIVQYLANSNNIAYLISIIVFRVFFIRISDYKATNGNCL